VKDLAIEFLLAYVQPVQGIVKSVEETGIDIPVMVVRGYGRKQALHSRDL
jgi:hypothetical protein